MKVFAMFARRPLLLSTLPLFIILFMREDDQKEYIMVMKVVGVNNVT
jgi:hypothetical protein